MAPAARARISTGLLLCFASVLALAACADAKPDVEPMADVASSASALIPHFLRPTTADLALPTATPQPTSRAEQAEGVAALTQLTAADVAVGATVPVCRPHLAPVLATTGDLPAVSTQLVGYSMRDRVFDVPSEKMYWATQAVRVFPEPAQAADVLRRASDAVKRCRGYVDDDLADSDAYAVTLRAPVRFQVGWLREGNLLYGWCFELPPGASRVDLATRIIENERARLAALGSVR